MSATTLSCAAFRGWTNPARIGGVIVADGARLRHGFDRSAAALECGKIIVNDAP